MQRQTLGGYTVLSSIKSNSSLKKILTKAESALYGVVNSNRIRTRPDRRSFTNKTRSQVIPDPKNGLLFTKSARNNSNF